MRKILDKMFGNRLSMFVPMVIAALIYLLFLLFGTAANKLRLTVLTPVLSIIWFFGVFFVIFVQIKNSTGSQWFLNLFELLAAIIFGVCATIGIVNFFVSGFHNYNLTICLGLVTVSAVSWAHSKRKNQ